LKHQTPQQQKLTACSTNDIVNEPID